MDFRFGSERHLLIWLNANLTSEYQPLFEIISGIEVLLIIIAYMVCPFLLIAVWRAAPLHVNIRLILIALILHGVMGILSRVVILYHQVFGRASPQALDYLTIASVVRDMLFAYGTTLTFLIAADRFVATYYWSWYEKQSRWTLSVALLLLLFAEVFSIVTAWFSIFRVYSFLTNFLVLCSMQFVGSVCFFFVYLYNQDLAKRYRIQFNLPNYSVCRSYQIKENLVVIKILYKIASTTLLLVPPFSLFAFYYATESIKSLDFIRKISMTIFDLSIAIFVIALEFRLMTADQRFQKGLQSIWGFAWLQSRSSARITSYKSAQENADFYFIQLNEDWKR